jgi:hypothetical protein
MSQKDQRSSERYDLAFPIKVKWKDASRHENEEATSTRDISLSGCFVICRNLIEKGCPIDVDIDLSIGEAGIREKHVSVRGRVVRSVTMGDPDKGSFGHGVKFDKFHFPGPL